MAQSSTERAKYGFKVSEGGVDEDSWSAFISCEPYGSGLDLLRGGLLSFDLPLGTTMERAEEIAAFLNSNISSIAFTFILENMSQSRQQSGES